MLSSELLIGTMPVHQACGGMGFGAGLKLRTQDLIKCLHKPTVDHFDHHGGFVNQIFCLPHRRHKNAGTIDSVRRLSGDVEELVGTQENSVWENGDINKEYEAQKHCQELRADVEKHMHIIFDLIKEMTKRLEKKSTGQRRMPTEDMIELIEQFIAADLPAQLFGQMPLLEFETRKDIMNVCSSILCPSMPAKIVREVVEYFRCHDRIFQVLVHGYDNEAVALHSGIVLRSCARHSSLVLAFLESRQVFELMRYTRHASIDISSDAFYTLREMLLEHREVAASWMYDNFTEFFEIYNQTLISGEYLAERQSQKLLAEMLLDRHYRKVMLAYVSSETNLKIHMNLLKDASKSIQFEAFHVFKIFVANPQKPARIHQILYKNRDKLISLLELLHSLKVEDKKFADDQKTIIQKLRRLESGSSPMCEQRPGAAMAHCAPLVRVS